MNPSCADVLPLSLVLASACVDKGSDTGKCGGFDDLITTTEIVAAAASAASGEFCVSVPGDEPPTCSIGEDSLRVSPDGEGVWEYCGYAPENGTVRCTYSSDGSCPNMIAQDNF